MQKAPSHPISRRTRRLVLALSAAVLAVMTGFTLQRHWQSRFVRQDGNGMLTYLPDKQADIFPDFSRVGYYQGNRPIPHVATAVTVSPSGIKGQDDQQRIQQAIDSLSALPIRQDGFRGALLLRKGTYRVKGTLHLDSSGIVIRGEGDGEKGTVVVATGTGQRTLIDIRGQGAPREVPASRSRITEPFVPVGVFGVTVENPALYHAGDRVILLRPGTQRWIHDLKMDQIVPKKNTVQWTPAQYNLRFKRRVTRVSGDTVFMDNPVVMQLSDIYGGGYLYRYTFPGCIRNVGVESIRFESEYAGETDENHGWTAVSMNAVTDAWVRGVTARYFGYSCVLLGTEASQVTVTDSRCLDAKSRITGGRRYSFCNNGQLNLFTRLFTREGRHDFVTGARTLGPNVFYDCVAERTHADIGPHHRWSVGTLYDRVRTDGRMSVQDRGNSGTGHGWTGVTQIFWNCRAREAVVQNPWVSGENYCIGLEGNKWAGHFPDRPQGVWEGENNPGLLPASLFLAQRSARSGQSAE
jgi:hypothetical protein